MRCASGRAKRVRNERFAVQYPELRVPLVSPAVADHPWVPSRNRHPCRSRQSYLPAVLKLEVATAS